MANHAINTVEPSAWRDRRDAHASPSALELTPKETLVTRKKPYADLTDLEKLQKQWHKLSRLHTREEWSAAIVRAATAAEIAANFAVRHELAVRSNLDASFINHLLRWANGLAGKLDRLLVPLSVGDAKKHKKLKQLKALAEKVNSKRNAIAHQGEFCNEEEAKESIQHAREFISDLVCLYEPTFVLKERKR